MSNFKTRARTIEMLGRQQIAGIPTAISELFKNAHDAYAEHVEADFLANQRTLVIRDDGYGMTREEFDDRWLTIGTDSKVDGGPGLPSDPNGRNDRRMLGEKGIGRLAVAIIGPQVLILTRAIRDGVPKDLIAAFINWAAFDLPGVNLDDVEIPIRIFQNGAVPTARDVEDLVQESLTNLENLRRLTTAREKLDESELSLLAFAMDVPAMTERLKGMQLSGKAHGTQFFIHPTDAGLAADLLPPGKDDEVSQLFQSLIGFSNTMTPGHTKPKVEIAFRNHSKPGLIEDIVGTGAFFSSEEFLSADHQFVGTFDEMGRFEGTASIYGSESEYRIQLPGSVKPLSCGGFGLSLAIMQGKSSESRLPLDGYTSLSNKLTRIGGLYIYKDDIRVLPYGRQDYDYLDIERNRSKSAGYYYYSYRNLFGAVDLTETGNPGLREKAGREGFQDNAAWRDFRNVLKNFFVQSAADFFRKDGQNVDLFEQRKAELGRAEKVRRQRESQSRAKRKKFETDLEKALKLIDGGQLSNNAAAIVDQAAVSLDQAIQQDNATLLLEAERAARRGLAALKSRASVSLPRGLALSAQVRRDWEAYQAELQRFDQTTFRAVEEQIGQIVASADAAIGRRVDQQRRVSSAVDDVIAEAQQSVRGASRKLDETLGSLSTGIATTRSAVMQSMTLVVDSARRQAHASEYSGLSENQLIEMRFELEQSVVVEAESARRALEYLNSQVAEIIWEVGEEGDVVTNADISASAEEEILALRERSEQDLELSQLGMAVSIIDHEFQSTIRSIRAGLQRLKAWADVNPPLLSIYNDLRTSFDHLDGYLTLFTPLQRRLRRSRTVVTGADIATFLESLFGEKLRAAGIELSVTVKFKQHSIFTFSSTIYPTFVNLVDNAIFWLGSVSANRQIILEELQGEMCVSDNGPGVPSRDIDEVFVSGFSRKPGGRGLGLSISRQALRSVGLDLSVDARGSLGGATFRISERNPNEIGES